jgi:hypothetical protein
MEVSGQLHDQSPGKSTGSDWIGGWVGPIVGLDVLETRKNVPAGMRTPYPSRCIDYTKSAHVEIKN